LADHRQRLFPDEFFEDLFGSGRGRPSVPADVVATVLVLQALEGLSDREASEALRRDLAWKAAAGLSVTNAGFHPTVLTYWRARLGRSVRGGSPQPKRGGPASLQRQPRRMTRPESVCPTPPRPRSFHKRPENRSAVSGLLPAGAAHEDRNQTYVAGLPNDRQSCPPTPSTQVCCKSATMPLIPRSG
jgi:Transposase domain (DUF772)